jgi:two-component system, OmpR family, phosphate regulon sensor histidine kinase PhoR
VPVTEPVTMLTFHLLSFLGGLAAGLGLLFLYRWRLARLVRRRGMVPPSRFMPPFTPLFGLTPQLVRTIGEYQQTVGRLQADLRDWKRVVAHAPIGYLQVDTEDQLVWCNPQALQMLGIADFSPTEPRLLLELVRSYDLDELIAQTRGQQAACQRDWTLNPASPDAVNLSTQQSSHLRGYALPLNQGQVGVVLENRQEAVLLRQQRDRWTSDVAHELKTPLTSIRLVAETLRSRVDPPLQIWLDRLLKEAMRLSNLVQEILDLSQLEALPLRPLKLHTTDLSQLVQTAWLSLEPLARSKQLQLDYQGPSYLALQADEARLHRVLINLLDNGIKYSPAHRPIQVQVALDCEQINIDVIDSGCGFAEADLPFVFDRFYRADRSRTRAEIPIGDSQRSQGNPTAAELPAPVELLSSGSGLGLAIVRQIVERHHGTIQARNHPATGGAWFHIQIPQSPPPVSPAAAR